MQPSPSGLVDALGSEQQQLAHVVEWVALPAPVRRGVSGERALTAHHGSTWNPYSQDRVRLSRAGNRQLNRAIHTIALTQARHHPDARAFLERRRTEHHDTPRAALRTLKRRLSDVIYRALLADTEAALHERLSTAAWT